MSELQQDYIDKLEGMVRELRQRVEEYESMRKELMDDPDIHWVPKQYLAASQQRITELEQICRDAYEVYAGSEGIPTPETAAEAYLYQLLMQMKDEIARGLK